MPRKSSASGSCRYVPHAHKLQCDESDRKLPDQCDETRPLAKVFPSPILWIVYQCNAIQCSLSKAPQVMA